MNESALRHGRVTPSTEPKPPRHGPDAHTLARREQTARPPGAAVDPQQAAGKASAAQRSRELRRELSRCLSPSSRLERPRERRCGSRPPPLSNSRSRRARLLRSRPASASSRGRFREPDEAALAASAAARAADTSWSSSSSSWPPTRFAMGSARTWRVSLNASISSAVGSAAVPTASLMNPRTRSSRTRPLSSSSCLRSSAACMRFRLMEPPARTSSSP
mmetsp:Transcript_3957/g.16504  ORF Transcript_3957/g.16504 Transcript_3957/m.16504 type:complete len:219 (-) Transcript_3957:495-1151(-)